MSKNNVTSNDVARLAEVSQSAVSRTFTPGASVAPETRARVLEAARKLGYRPNAIASTLSTRRSRMIAVVLSNLQNQFYPVVIEELSQRLQKDGYHVLLFITETEDADELLLELMRYQVDGVVMASTHLSSGLAQQMEDARIPIVMFNRTSSKGSISTVSSDNFGGGRAVANFLADGGHQRVAYLAGAEDSSTNQDREAGLRIGLSERGLRIVARAVGNYEFEGAAQATRELFDGLVNSPDRPDALFVASDHMAFAAIDTLRSLGFARAGGRFRRGLRQRAAGRLGRLRPHHHRTKRRADDRSHGAHASEAARRRRCHERPRRGAHPPGGAHLRATTAIRITPLSPGVAAGLD